jgi:hypothetical protein
VNGVRSPRSGLDHLAPAGVWSRAIPDAILKMARRGLIARFGPRNQRLSLLYADDLASAVKAWLAAWPKCAGMTCSIDDGHAGGYDWAGIVRAAGGARYRAVGVPSPLLAVIARLNMIVAGLPFIRLCCRPARCGK